MSTFPPGPPLRLRAASELAPQSYVWLWVYRLALGEPALFEGDPGLGKSLVALDLCARLSTGRPMPDGSPGPGRANSLIVFDEDAAHAIRGRLEGLGADMSHVFLVDRHDGQDGEPVSFPHDTHRLVELVAQVQARLVVLDPVLSFLGPGVNPNNDQSVRRALWPLRQLARQHQFVPLLVRNLNKAGRQKALYRGSGAMAFLGVARAGWLFGRDPQQPERFVMAEQKNNVGPPQPSLAYTVTSGKDGLAQVSWAGPCPWAPADLLGAAAYGPPPRDRARAFLAEMLEGGPCTPRQVWEAAQAQGLSLRTLRRAREELGVRVARRSEGQAPVYYWMLPGQQLPDSAPPPDESADLGPWLRRLEEQFPPRTPLDEP
jgi:hypothetical protein